MTSILLMSFSLFRSIHWRGRGFPNAMWEALYTLGTIVQLSPSSTTSLWPQLTIHPRKRRRRRLKPRNQMQVSISSFAHSLPKSIDHPLDKKTLKELVEKTPFHIIFAGTPQARTTSVMFADLKAAANNLEMYDITLATVRKCANLWVGSCMTLSVLYIDILARWIGLRSTCSALTIQTR